MCGWDSGVSCFVVISVGTLVNMVFQLVSVLVVVVAGMVLVAVVFSFEGALSISQRKLQVFGLWLCPVCAWW